MLATIAEMDSMVGVTLQFARDEAATELGVPPTSRRLSKASSMTWPTPACPSKWSQPSLIVYDCRPDALKRAIRNLLDNAVKYGKAASVAIQTTPKAIEIMIDDEGPGIPERSSRGCSIRSIVLKNHEAVRPAVSAWDWLLRYLQCKPTGVN